MNPEECKAWVLDTLRACMTGERETGSDADILLRETGERMAKRSNAGRTAAAARWRQDANAMRTHSERNAEACHNRTGDNTTLEEKTPKEDIKIQPNTNPNPPPPVGGGNLGGIAGRALEGLTVGAGGDPLRRFMASPKDTVWQLTDNLLPRAVALYCKADNQERTETAFKRILPLVGASRFRSEFGRFIAEGEQGELDAVQNKAACFMARLKESKTP